MLYIRFVQKKVQKVISIGVPLVELCSTFTCYALTQNTNDKLLSHQSARLTNNDSRVCAVATDQAGMAGLGRQSTRVADSQWKNVNKRILPTRLQRLSQKM